MRDDKPGKEPLLRIEGLRVWFEGERNLFARTPPLRAVDGVDLKIEEGETLGLVGESGCGKSTLGRALMRLEEPTQGEIWFAGKNLGAMSGARLREARRDIQMIFQDPLSCLDPRMKVRRIIGEGLAIAGIPKAEREHLDRYPHEFSGGQRQRIGIARALATRPRFIVADEPVSALDVSIQSQIVNLMKDLQAEFGLTYLFIAHDLGVVGYISDRVGVMYLGRIVELADAEELYDNPLMPYTQVLLSAMPEEEARGRKRIIPQGEVPSPRNPPSGCAFRTRCWRARPLCAEQRPELRELRPRHWAACHFAE